MRRSTGAPGLLAAMLLLSAVGCTEPAADRPLDVAPAPTETAASGGAGSTPRPSATVDPATAGAVVADYLRYWDGVLAAHASRNPADARLRRYARAAAYSRVVTAVRTNAVRGYFRRGTVGHAPTVTSVGGDTAHLRDCADVTRWTIHSARTGKPVPIGASEPRLTTTYELSRQDGRWVVVGAVDGRGC